jgi:PPOX class probable F420-dependent enzyme
MPGRRDEITMSDAELRAFLGERVVMQCATIGPNGRPHMMPLWYVPDGVELLSWTYAKSQKSKNLERDARATVGIETGVQYHELRGVTFECDVDLEREPERVETYGLRLFERLAGEVTPEMRAMIAQQAQKRVGMRFVPTRTVSWDHGKLGGAY